MTMFAKTAVSLALLLLSVTAEKLQLTLEPASEFHNMTGTGPTERILYVRLVEPHAAEFCEEQLLNPANFRHSTDP